MKKGDKVRISKYLQFDYPYSKDGILKPRFQSIEPLEIISPISVPVSVPIDNYSNIKCGIAFKSACPGILIGKTKKAIGMYKNSRHFGDDYSRGELRIYAWVTVWLVEPQGNNIGYIHPVYVREKDMEII